MDNYPDQTIKERVEYALSKLFEKDAFLLQNDVNERTITHRLAMYLQEAFPEWDVDCEYNRNHDDIKRLHLRVHATQTDDTEACTVFPDIIVHHRNTDENLVVIEIKKSTNRQSNDEDLKKLAAFKSQLGYQHAIFFRLKTDEAEVGSKEEHWVK